MTIEKNRRTVPQAKRVISSKAPTRIDLAGGTLDLWPLYLFLEEPYTINVAIDLFAETHLEIIPSATPKVLLQTEDQKTHLELSWEDLENTSFPIPPSLELHYKLLRFFYKMKEKTSPPTETLFIKTCAQSPAGAGLGGSSALSISLIGALHAWTFSEKPLSLEHFIPIARDIETTVLQIPAGLQDYYSAVFGGLQALHWGVAQHTRYPFSKDFLAELNDRILLFYSGQSRNSGINNWTVFQAFLNQSSNTRAQFEKIHKATHQLKTALLKKDWIAVGDAIAAEWSIRKTLAEGITTPSMDRAFQECSLLGPVVGKVCGAGGGGCFFVYLQHETVSEREKIWPEIQKIFHHHGMKSLHFRMVDHGLEVKTYDIQMD